MTTIERRSRLWFNNTYLKPREGLKKMEFSMFG